MDFKDFEKKILRKIDNSVDLIKNNVENSKEVTEKAGDITNKAMLLFNTMKERNSMYIGIITVLIFGFGLAFFTWVSDSFIRLPKIEQKYFESVVEMNYKFDSLEKDYEILKKEFNLMEKKNDFILNELNNKKIEK